MNFGYWVVANMSPRGEWAIVGRKPTRFDSKAAADVVASELNGAGHGWSAYPIGTGRGTFEIVHTEAKGRFLRMNLGG